MQVLQILTVLPNPSHPYIRCWQDSRHLLNRYVYTYSLYVLRALTVCMNIRSQSACFVSSMAVHARHTYVLSALSFLTQVSELTGGEGQQDEVYT